MYTGPGLQQRRSLGFVQATQVLPLYKWQSMSLWSLLWAQWYCYAGTGLGLLVSLKENCNAIALYQLIPCNHYYGLNQNFMEKLGGCNAKGCNTLNDTQLAEQYMQKLLLCKWCTNYICMCTWRISSDGTVKNHHGKKTTSSFVLTHYIIFC